MVSGTRIVILAAAAGMVAGLALSYAAPGSYVSQIVMSVQGPLTPQARMDLIGSLEQRAWPRIVLTRMIENFGLYGGRLSADALQDAVTKMRGDISTAPVGGPGAGVESVFAIRFRYSDPAAARSVSTDLAQRLIAENHRGEELGIPGAFLQIVSPATLPGYAFGSKRFLLMGEGLALGLVVGGLLAMRRKSA